MHEKRIRNILLAIVAGLLLLNLGVMLSPAAHAIPKTQYKAIDIPPTNGRIEAISVQRILDQQNTQGWEYAGSSGVTLIFKK